MGLFDSFLLADQRAVMRLDDVRVGIQFPDSSAVSHAVYNISTMELALRYSSGGEYVYTKVPASRVIEMLVADSVGSYVNAFIKGAHASHRVYPERSLSRMARAV